MTNLTYTDIIQQCIHYTHLSIRNMATGKVAKEADAQCLLTRDETTWCVAVYPSIFMADQSIDTRLLNQGLAFMHSMQCLLVSARHTHARVYWESCTLSLPSRAFGECNGVSTAQLAKAL